MIEIKKEKSERGDGFLFVNGVKADKPYTLSGRKWENEDPHEGFPIGLVDEPCMGFPENISIWIGLKLDLKQGCLDNLFISRKGKKICLIVTFFAADLTIDPTTYVLNPMRLAKLLHDSALKDGFEIEHKSLELWDDIPGVCAVQQYYQAKDTIKGWLDEFLQKIVHIADEAYATMLQEAKKLTE